MCRSTGSPSAATTRAPTRLPSSIDGTGNDLSARLASTRKEIGPALGARGMRSIAARASSTAASPMAVSSAATTRATESDTRPKTRATRVRGLLDVVAGHAHEDAAVRRLDARLGHARDGRLHVVHEHALEALAVAALEEELAVAAEEDRLAIHVGAVFLPACEGLGERRDLLDGAAQRVHGGVDVARHRRAREREAQHGRPIVDADGLEHGAGAARARGAGGPGRAVDVARLERVQERLGGQAGEGERRDVRRARRARRP